MNIIKLDISEKEIDLLVTQLTKDAETKGYFINPNKEFTRNLIKGLIINQKRYGYMACPCRLAKGDRENDLDIICPCDYRDIDLSEYGYCYCSLYVNEKNFKELKFKPIPDRRNKIIGNKEGENMKTENKLSVWRCKVCGYLCARESPPEKCPICGVEHDRFERFE